MLARRTARGLLILSLGGMAMGCVTATATAPLAPTPQTSSPVETEVPPAASPSPSPVAPRGSIPAGEVLLTGGFMQIDVCPVLAVRDPESTASPPFGKPYELMLPDGWEFVGPEPDTIRDADGHIMAQVGDRITVHGKLGTPYASFCGVGEGLQIIEIRVEPAP